MCPRIDYILILITKLTQPREYTQKTTKTNRKTNLPQMQKQKHQKKTTELNGTVVLVMLWHLVNCCIIIIIITVQHSSAITICKGHNRYV